jgi:glycosyltransferase involved in cell wall biosynthesis
MKIAMIAGNGGSGGLIAYIKGLITANVVPENAEIKLFCGTSLAENLDEVADRIKIHPTNLANESGKDIVLNRPLNKKFIEIIDIYNPEIVVFLNGYIRKGLEHYPNVMILHNQLYVDNKQLWRQGVSKLTLILLAFRHHVRKSMRNSSGVIFLSNASRMQAKDKRLKYKKSKVTYFGLEQENRKGFFEEKPLNTPINMIYISAIYPYKNQIELVKGLSLLKKDKVDFRLHLVGIADPKTKKKLISVIKQNHLQDNVVFYDWVRHDDIKKMIDSSDIFLYPSSIETTGYGLMEGMGRGIPIASSDTECFREILGDGGIYFNPNDSMSIYSAVKTLINDKQLRSKYASDALEISKKFTWDNLAIETYKFLKLIVSEEK